jgi:pyruvate dehydrogenase E2 component (dihydrolipoamide acetyltransferase)
VPYALKLPDLGEGLTEGEVGRWLVAEGQEVAEDQPLVEIATDKTTVEIPSPAAGTILRILVPEGELAPVGAVLVEIGEAREDAAAPAPARPPARPREERVRATPRVRAIARRLGVDLEALTPTGPNGRVTEEDVRSATVGHAPAPAGTVRDGSGPAPDTRAGRREPLRGVRRQIAEHLARAHREIPAVTFVEECDLTGVDLAQLVPLALRAAAESLKLFPELNARLEGDEVVYLDRYDLGLAVQTDAGLVVPVVRSCDTRSLDELAADAARLAEAARVGTLAPEELRGSTFTITSAGKLGGLFVTPLINHPEVAILGLHRIADRPVVIDGGIHVRRMGNVSVTFDHRVVDGARAAAFCLDVIGRLSAAGAPR